MIFEHRYYIPPESGLISTVLCMRCGYTIKSPELTKDEMVARYRERKVTWKNGDGKRGDGVIILCPACVDLDIEQGHLKLIHKQIVKGLEDEAKWMNVPYHNYLADMQILMEEKI